jgi:capsular exopolysaccharide synthesis family protein
MFDLQILGSVPKGLLLPSRLGSPEDSKNTQHIEEAYRLLSFNLMSSRNQSSGKEEKTILITSATSREGKSTVAANLAQTLAERGRTVFLVDSDLRHPTMAKIFGQDDGMGLNNLLTESRVLNDTTLSQLIYPTENPCLFVINGGGPAATNPTARLASPAMEQLINYLGKQGQTTILDTPPVLGMADTSVLAPKVDGVILVVREAFSTREAVRETLKQLNAAGAKVIGAIFIKKSSNGRY